MHPLDCLNLYPYLNVGLVHGPWISSQGCLNARGINAIFTCVDRLTKFTKLTPCSLGGGELSAQAVADLFFGTVVRQFGLPDTVVHDRDPRFTADFWGQLWKLLGSRALFSTAYHPQTDGQTER